MLVSAPQEVRERLLKAKIAECVQRCAGLRSLGKTPILQALTATLRLLAKRWLALQDEIKTLDAILDLAHIEVFTGLVSDGRYGLLAHHTA